MATTNWKGGNGNWQTAANWTAGAPTTPQSFAVINAPGTYTVSIGSGLEYHVGAVTLNDAGATLSIAGILDLKNRLTVTKGTLALSGTIAGGIIVANGGTITSKNGTLDAVTYRGLLNLSTNGNVLTIKDGLTMHGADGTGRGTLRLGGNSQLDFQGDQTIDNAIVTIDGGVVGFGGTVTFGASTSVIFKTSTQFQDGKLVVNQGTWQVGKAAEVSVDFQVDNGGRIVVGAGGAMVAQSDLSNTANGKILVQAGATFQVGSFDNAGVLVGNGATIKLSSETGDFGTLNIRNSVVDLNGITSVTALNTLSDMLAGHNNQVTFGVYLDNTGNTLNLGTESGFKSLAYSGSITGGTVEIASAFTGSLTDLTVDGSLDVVGDLTLQNVSFAGAGGSGIGTIDLNGTLAAGSPLNNVAIIATAGSALATLGRVSSILGANTSVQAQGNFTLGIAGSKQRVNNEGSLEEDGPGTFKVFGYSFTNEGSVKVENGGRFLVSTRLGLDTSGSTLSGGTYVVGAHSTITVNVGFGVINTLQANVVYEGVGATFLPSGDLGAIGTQGVLTLENGATLAVQAAFTIDGALNLSGSNFSSAQITIDAGGSLGGHGQVRGAVANNGTIDATGGGLSISQDVTGTGQATIENGAALAFDSDVSSGQTVTFESASGRLSLGFAGGFAGTIAGFAAGDTIHLINTAATTVGYNAVKDTLTIRNKGTLVATLQLSGDYTGDSFGIASDGKGSTDITVATATASVHRFIEAVAASSGSSMASVGHSSSLDTGHLNPPLAASSGIHFGH